MLPKAEMVLFVREAHGEPAILTQIEWVPATKLQNALLRAAQWLRQADLDVGGHRIPIVDSVRTDRAVKAIQLSRARMLPLN